MKRVLVGGGTGLIGRHLTAALDARGYDVVVISRTNNSNRPAVTWKQVETDGLPACDAVINLAGSSVLNLAKRWSPAAAEEVRQSRLHTNGLLASAISSAERRPKVFVSASGVGYYPSYATAEDAPEVDETGPAASDNFLSVLAQEWEGAAQSVADHGVRYVTMRTGAVLASDGGAVAQALLPFKLGLGGPIGSGRQLFPWCHIDDVVGLYIHALENDSVQGPVNAVAPGVATNAEYTRAFAAAVHRYAVVPMPAFAVRLLFGPDLSPMLLEGQRAVPRKALATGYTFQHPSISEAMQHLLSTR